MRSVVVALMALAANASSAEGQTQPLPSWADSFAVVTPGPNYARGGPAREVAGRHYRDLWTIPIRVPVVALSRFGGGLTPIRSHTGSQTKSLRLRGADGRVYQFRSVDKDPTASLAPELQGSAYARALKDGVSASFPAAPLVAGALLEAVDIPVQQQTLALMPDDPALGPFREDFKGVLVMIEERPDGRAEVTEAGTGSRRVISPSALFERIDASPGDRVDARAFLRARLMDMVMGDRDRHRDQFRWTSSGDGRPTIWRPISRDHDEAFVQLDGLALDLARIYYPPLVTFGQEYPKHYRLNWHAREVDRRFLVELDRAAWDSIATALQATLTDAAIDGAVRQMPPEMYPVGGERLALVLRGRRDGLVVQALSYYDFLAREVEVRATDAAEVAEITRVGDHHLDLTIRSQQDSQPYFRRRFDAQETDEIRLMMWGGDDQVIVRGGPAPAIRIRAVGGAGDDLFADSTGGGGLKAYDDTGNNQAEGNRFTINGKRHRDWVGSDADRYPPREWGTWWRPLPWLATSSDLGLFVGGGFLRTEYGFRRRPYASEIRALVGYATGAQAFRADVEGDFHPENASHFWRLHLRASGIEVLRYYGLGNETPNLDDPDFNRVSQQRYLLEPSLVVPVARNFRTSVGLSARWSRTGANEGRFIAALRDTLLGGRDFGQIGARVTAELDTRDRPMNPMRGVHLFAAGEVYPAVWDVPGTFGAGEAQAAAFVSAPVAGTPTLALRAGGRKVWGRFPFHEAAFLGGWSTLPGYHSNRFAGDASVYGGAQLRLTVGTTDLALPAVWGVFGAADVGRVYVDGESPGGWHSGAGGGIWLAFLDRRNAVSLGFTSGKEGTLLQGGMAFGF